MRASAKAAGSTLPPLSTIAVRPSSPHLAGQRRRQRRRAAGFDDQPEPREGETLRRADLGLGDREARGTRALSTAKLTGRVASVCSASHAVGGGLGPTATISPASRLRRTSSQPSGSTGTISASGQARARPAVSPPPPHGHDDPRRRAARALGHLRGDLDAGAALALDHPRIGIGMDQGRAGLREQPRGDLVAILAAGAVVEHDLRAQRARAGELHLGRVARHHDRRRRCRARCAAQATPCAWLPLDTPTTPRARSSSDRSVSRCHAPRILNAPTGCRLSALAHTVAPPISTGSSGVGGRIAATLVGGAQHALARRRSHGYPSVIGAPRGIFTRGLSSV